MTRLSRNPAAPADPWFITTFYHFTPLADPQAVADEWEKVAEKHSIDGLLVVGSEGFNATMAAPSRRLRESFQNWVRERFSLPNLFFKDSESEIRPFPKFRVKIRPEIVTTGAPDLHPDNRPHRHLSPAEWSEALREPGTVVLDTRNWYEVKIGTFKGAVDPQIEQFTDFFEFVDQQNYAPDQKMLIFCTGGIRCEKGILELENRGYKNVYQLEGGILNYLKEKPNADFEGECFVFDNRVAVDQELKPSTQYKLCPHCGQPAATAIQCVRCDQHTVICEKCHLEQAGIATCSKNCAHHHRLNPSQKGRPQIPTWQKARTRSSQNEAKTRRT